MADPRGGTDGDGDGNALPARRSSSTARRRLGEELRAIRDGVDLTLTQAARRIQRSAPTLSRLENGKSVPRLVDVAALLDHYASISPSRVSASARARIIGLAEDARDEEWFTSFRDVLSGDATRDDVLRYVGYENDAEEIRWFEPDLVPGLLQTRRYAEAVVAHYYPTRSADDQQRLVEFRLERQRVLRRTAGAPRVRIIIGELVVQRIVSSHVAMREQLGHLLDCVRGGSPNVEVRMVRADLGMPAAIGGPFIVMSLPAGEPGVVYVESREGAIYRQDEASLSRYARHFDDLHSAALEPHEAARSISAMLTTLDSEDV